MMLFCGVTFVGAVNVGYGVSLGTAMDAPNQATSPNIEASSRMFVVCWPPTQIQLQWQRCSSRTE